MILSPRLGLIWVAMVSLSKALPHVANVNDVKSVPSSKTLGHGPAIPPSLPSNEDDDLSHTTLSSRDTALLLADFGLGDFDGDFIEGPVLKRRGAVEGDIPDSIVSGAKHSKDLAKKEKLNLMRKIHDKEIKMAELTLKKTVTLFYLDDHGKVMSKHLDKSKKKHDKGAAF
ncbi:hypothetical protein V8E36_003619 [Tilletia maclaganii]